MADDHTSFVIIIIFVLLFFVFINTQTEYTGSAIFEGISTLTIVVAIVVVIAVLGIIFFILRKFKRKKIGVIPPAPRPAAGKVSSLQFPSSSMNAVIPSAPSASNAPNAPSSSAASTVFDNVKLNEEELSSLFREPIVKEEKKELPKEQIKEKPEVLETPQKEKTLANLSELKDLINKLLSKDYGKEQIIKFLQSKGWSALQINKTVEEINNENLRKYIKEARQIGMNNEQIIKSLVENGWRIDVVKKILENNSVKNALQ